MKRKLVWVFALSIALLGSNACSDEVEGTNEGDNVRSGSGDGDGDGTFEDAGIPGADISECTPGETLGCAGGDAVLACNAEGDGTEVQSCPSEAPYCLDGECGDQVCIPSARSCVDTENFQRCNADGTGYQEPEACPDDALCENGYCTTTCQLGSKQMSSHFGCEYWTVYLDQYDEDDVLGDMPSFGTPASEVPHAVVISNPNDDDATVQFQTFHGGVIVDVPDPIVPAGQSKAFTMPRMSLDETGITQKAIFVRSTLPVTAHQFNPLNNESVFSNDASLLLPVSALGTEYYVMSWPTQGIDMDDGFGDFPIPIPGGDGDSDFDLDFEPQQAFATIIAASEGITTVHVTSTANIEEGSTMEGFDAGTTQVFELNNADVLNLQAAAGGMSDGQSDLTGTHITSDKPIAVFGGHEQAVIGYDSDRESCCADHIEQQMFPLDTWGQRYMAAFSPGRTNTKDHWRIMAGENNVTVTTNPPQPEANNVTLNAGEFVAFFSDENFEIQGTGKLMVGQMLASQQQTAEITGDPAFILSVPMESWRDEYHVLTPEDYARDFITVIRPAGVEVILDGSPVSDAAFEAIGSGEFETAAFEVNPGVHVLESAEPFAASAYGMDNAVSYGYPGGLNIPDPD